MTAARLNKYEILRLLARGGMAEVHLARTVGPYGIDKLVVVKRLLPEFAADRQFKNLFVDEARLAVLLEHPNIVQVYDVDEADGQVFYVMEYLHGRDVRQVVRALDGRRMPLDQAIAIVTLACSGLHYAHERHGPEGNPLGIVHRDVSPHNLFVRYDGVVKVIDFGIAKALHNHDRTATGELRGKFGYMSPEQCLTQPLDRRSDIFSLGIVLYELTTGRRLYAGPNEYVILRSVVEEDVEAPSALDPSYPPALSRIVMRSLSRDRIARYPTAEALQGELEAFALATGLDLSTRGLRGFLDQLFPGEASASPQMQLATFSAAEARPKDTQARAPNGSDSAPGVGGSATRTAAVTESIANPARPPLGVAKLALAALVIVGAGVVLGRLSAGDASNGVEASAPSAPTAPETRAVAAEPTASSATLLVAPVSASLSASAEASTTSSAPVDRLRNRPTLPARPPIVKSTASSRVVDPDAPLPH